VGSDIIGDPSNVVRRYAPYGAYRSPPLKQKQGKWKKEDKDIMNDE
jgi:hypothetical protein